jgi:hypothetical protein
VGPPVFQAVLPSIGRWALGTTFAIVGVASLPHSAHAFCVSGSLAVDGNNCTTFYSGSTSASQATIRLSDPKLNNSVAPLRAGARYFQIVMNTVLGGSYTVSNFEWSRLPGGSFSSFQSSLAVGATAVATGVTDILAASGSDPLGNPFYVRYTIPAGVALNETFEVKFLANNNGAVDANGLLTGSSLTSFVDLNRDHTSRENVPGPLPAVGVFMALGTASRFRRRLKAASGAK